MGIFKYTVWNAVHLNRVSTTCLNIEHYRSKQMAYNDINTKSWYVFTHIQEPTTTSYKIPRLSP